MKKQKEENTVPQEEIINEAETMLPETLDAEKLTKDLEVKCEQFDELSEKYVRLVAEYDNFRKRTQKEKDAIYTDAISTVTAAWLTVMDNMERGIQSAETLENKEAVKVADGMKMVLRQAQEVIESFGVKEVDALGKTFDPNTMEAVMHCEDENAGENEVIDVLTKGYIKGEKVIRHAIVRVAN